MKKYLFIYSNSVIYTCWDHLSFEDGYYDEEVTFPNKVTDWEVIEKAKEFQQFGEIANDNCAGESKTTKLLVRIIELSRDLSFDKDHYPAIQDSEEARTDASPANN